MDLDSSRLKRQRSASSSSSSSLTSGSASRSRSRSPSLSLTPPPPKFHRLTSHQGQHECILPPTCSAAPTYYTTSAELERHQETFHRYICRIPIRDRDTVHGHGHSPKGKGEAKEKRGPVPDGIPETFVHQRGQKRWKECAKVFPEQRLLDLHHTETHDPLAREKKERGEKIFACFLPPELCGRKFIDPRKRRNHLIDKHKYPKQYFFSITNHGLNDVVRQDGLAISLIRPRKDPPANSSSSLPASASVVASTLDCHAVKSQATEGAVAAPKRTGMGGNTGAGQGEGKANDDFRDADVDMDVDSLTKAMNGLESSLSFVPRGVRKKAASMATATATATAELA